MEFLQYARILRRQWTLVAVSIILALTAAALATIRATPNYSASVTLLVSAQGRSNDAGSAYQASLLSQERVKAYASLLTSQRVARELAREIGGNISPRALQGQISSEIVPESVLLKATVTDTSPQRAKEIADTLGAVFARQIDAIERPSGGDRSPAKVTVADDAELPTAPVSPQPLFNLGLGLLVGLLVGAAAAVLRETLDTSVKSAQALEEVASASTLGTISFDRGARDRPLIVQSESSSLRAEAFRSLRTNLQFADVDNPPRSVVITSAQADEGKTTTACNLAITLAQAGWRVILVEADLRRPRVSEYLGIVGAAGLTSVLIGGADLGEVLQPWGRESLSVLPCGPIPPNPSELLGSRLMANVLKQLEEKADIVLVDAPPLLPVTDGSILARICDGTLLVARHGKTRREQVTRAVAQLNAVDARLLGTVLNFVPTKGRDGYYYEYSYPSRSQPAQLIEEPVREPI